MPPHDPVSGDGSLATISLRAKGEGEGTLVLRSVLLADPDGNPIPAEVTVDRVAVVVGGSSARPCPLAGALFLTALGLGMVVRFRRVGFGGEPTFAEADKAE